MSENIFFQLKTYIWYWRLNWAVFSSLWSFDEEKFGFLYWSNPRGSGWIIGGSLEMTYFKWIFKIYLEQVLHDVVVVPFLLVKNILTPVYSVQVFHIWQEIFDGLVKMKRYWEVYYSGYIESKWIVSSIQKYVCCCCWGLIW